MQVTAQRAAGRAQAAADPGFGAPGGDVDQRGASADGRALVDCAWARVLPVGPAVWRIVSPDGRIRGHVRLVGAPEEERYRVERFSPSSRTFISAGEFWSAADALACVRYLR